MASLCGSNLRLWDSKLAWNNHNGFDLTSCFQETFLLWIPLAFITLGGPCDLLIRASQIPHRTISYFTAIKKFSRRELCISLIILIFSLIELYVNVGIIIKGQLSDKDGVIQWLSPLLMSLAMVISIIISLVQKRYGLYNSGVLFTFWLMLSIKTIITTLSLVRWELQLRKKSAIHMNHNINTTHHAMSPTHVLNHTQSIVNLLHINHGNHASFGKHPADQLANESLECADWNGYFRLDDNRVSFVVRIKMLVSVVVIIQLVTICLQKFKLDQLADVDQYHEFRTYSENAKIDMSPSKNAAILSWLTFNWLNKLIALGHKRRLEQSDLIEHSVNFRLVTNRPIFNENLRRSVKLALEFRKNRIKLVQQIRACVKHPTLASNDVDQLIMQLDSKLNPIDFHVLLFNSKASAADVINQLEASETEPKFVRLINIIVTSFKWQFFQCFLLRILSTVCRFSIPFILNEHIYFLTHASSEKQPFWHGWIYIICLLLATFLQILVDCRESYLFGRLKIDLTNCLRLAIHKKTTKLSLLGKRGLVSGVIINMLSIDTERVMRFVGRMDVFVIAPIRIIIAVCILYYHFGPAALGSIPIILLIFPSSALMAKVMRPVIVNSVNLRDFRMKLVTELFNAIKIIKIYAWENSFFQRIGKIRDSEAHYIKIDGLLSTIEMFKYTFYPTILMIVVFAIFLYTGSSVDVHSAASIGASAGSVGNPAQLNQIDASSIFTTSHLLTTNRIFVGSTLFSMISSEINSLSDPMSSFFIFLVAIKRLNLFMEREERPDSSEDSDDEQEDSDDGEASGAYWRTFEGERIEMKVIESDLLGTEPEVAIRLTDAHFRWDSKTEFELNSINMSILKGKLVAIVGRIGSGKSSLLSAMLGDIEHIGGSVEIDKHTSIGYVSQEPWILNDTIINNICLGLPFEREKYDRVIEACALQPDFDTFPFGDKSEIGEKGLNLSGGQKQRIALARAIYLDTQILLLDDPLSAVDAHIAKHLFDRVLANGDDNPSLLADKTRVLVTNKLSITPNVDHIYMFNEGSIIESGSCLELLKNRGHFAKLYINQLLEDKMGDKANDTKGDKLVFTDKEEKLINEEMKRLSRLIKERSKRKSASLVSNNNLNNKANKRASTRSNKAPALDLGNYAESGDADDDASLIPLRLDGYSGFMSQRKDQEGLDRCERMSMASMTSSAAISAANEFKMSTCSDRRTPATFGKQKAIASEQRHFMTDKEAIETNIESCERIKIYWLIIKSIGLKGFLSLALIVAGCAFTIGSNIWLARWSNDSQNSNHSGSSMLRSFRLIIYAVLRIGDCSCNFAGVCLMGLAFINLSLHLHQEALRSVLNAPMSWFDRTPVGRLLNIFSNDVEVIDDDVRMAVISFLIGSSSMVGTLITVSLGSPYTILVAIPTVIIYVIIYLYYIPTSIQLERLDLATAAPIYSHFNETLNGLSTIRAFKLEHHFANQLNDKLNDNNVSRYLYKATMAWFEIRIRSLSLLILLAVSVASILTMGSTTPGIAALTVTYAINMTPSLGYLIEIWSRLQRELVSVERIRQYSRVASERLLANQRPDNQQNVTAYYSAPSSLSSYGSSSSSCGASAITKPIDCWPERGEIEFDAYSCRYRAELDLVLREFSIHINAGEKIGFVGRTGAGKSSVILAMLRIFEPAEGRIVVDSVDISQMDLRYLRSRMSIIPQEPTLFTGSLRQNIDPSERHTDEQIWDAIKLAHSDQFVNSLPKRLDHVVQEAGSNFSLGQKQLFCLARAILRRSKILLLDEATAALDSMTDEIIQRTIRTEFADSTVLTVAHRLETIMDYDRVCVIDRGQIIELDSPANLLKQKQSKFYLLAKEDGLV